MTLLYVLLFSKMNTKEFAANPLKLVHLKPGIQNHQTRHRRSRLLRGRGGGLNAEVALCDADYTGIYSPEAAPSGPHC